MSKVTRELVDLRYVKWDRIRNSSGTAGSYLKAYETVNGRKLYYKLSNFDSEKGVVGHECVNELIVDRLLDVLNVEHLSYDLVYSLINVDGKEHKTYLCVSKDFKEINESKISLDTYYELSKENDETIMDFIIRNKIDNYIYQMMLVDFLIINRDRHGANIELIKKSDGSIIPSPLFDHGLSFVFSINDLESLDKFDSLADIKVNNFVGSKSLVDNLKLIPKDKLPVLRRIDESDYKYIFADLEGILDEKYYSKIWDIITKRWKYYENMFN